MNIIELKEFVNSYGTISALPKSPVAGEWKKAHAAISPHYYGEVPPILGKTFPNEDPLIYNYRKETYQPKTKACIADAIDKLSRLLSSSKHAVNYESERMKSFVEGFEVGGVTLAQWFLKKFVSRRVLDPNSLLVVNIKGKAVTQYFETGIADNTALVDIDFHFVASSDIVFFDEDLGLLIYNAPSKSRFDLRPSNEFAIVTDEFFARAKYQDGELLIFNYYEHQLGKMPAVILGGRTMSLSKQGHEFTYFESDLSAAIPYMNDAVVSDNQYKSVVYANAFPVRILEGVECRTCNGQGFTTEVTATNADGEHIYCGTCRGTGTAHIGPLEGIVLRPKKAMGDDSSDTKKPIEFVSPNVDVIQHLAEYKTQTMQDVREVLSIDNAVKFAQSGVAKEIDQQEGWIKIKEVSDDVYLKYSYILGIIQGLRFPAEMDAKITLIAPTSFDIKNEQEAYAELQSTIVSKAPDFVREAAFMSWLKTRFATDLVAQRIGEICVGYAPAFFKTIEEQKELYFMGVFSANTLVKSNFVLSAIMALYEADKTIIFEPFDVIFGKIDEILEPELQKAQQQEVPDTIDPTTEEL